MAEKEEALQLFDALDGRKKTLFIAAIQCVSVDENCPQKNDKDIDVIETASGGGDDL